MDERNQGKLGVTECKNFKQNFKSQKDITKKL